MQQSSSQDIAAFETPPEVRRSTLLLEDDAEARGFLRNALAVCSGAGHIDEAESLAQCCHKLHQRQYDLLLVDLHLPDGSGLEAVRLARTLTKPPLVLVVSSIIDEANVLAAIVAGASGYVSKFDASADIERSMAIALAGGSTLSPAIAARIIDSLRVQRPVAGSPSMILTPRESEILTLAHRGHNYRQIAEMIGCRPSTVYTHVRHIYEKLQVSTLQQALYEARSLDLLA